jgi:hypothetical protein
VSSLISWRSERARVASLSRSRTADDPELVAARLNLKASRLEDHVKTVVDSWPPLTPGQLARVAILLRPTSGDSA